MPRISKEEYRQRRAGILQAARTAFAQKGIHISVDEVCKAAGVSKGAFYGYFRSKDELFEGLAEDHGAVLSESSQAGDRLALQRMLEERANIPTPDFAQVELETWTYAIRHPGLRSIFIQNTERLSATLETALAEFGGEQMDAGRLATIVQLVVQGAFLNIALKGSAAAQETQVALEDLLNLLSRTKDN